MTIERAALCCAALTAALLASCGGGGGSAATPTVSPTIAPTSAPTAASASASPAPYEAAAYACPTSQTSTTSVTRAGTSAGSSSEATARFAVRRPATNVSPSSALLAVTYATTTATRSASTIAAAEARAGATLVRTLAFDRLGTTVHLVAVPSGGTASIAAALRTQSGVSRVDPTGFPRFAQTVSGPTYTNDPYFNGFQSTVAVGASPPPAPTYHVQPYVESANVPGQWDMQAIRLAYAFSYATPSNGSNAFSSGAMGSPNVKIAIIDTGADANHPELASKIVHQQCFITDSTTGVQSSGSYATDPQGHGTDVAGIAAAASGNALGFVGAGGSAEIEAYRVFPTPDDNCTTPDSTDPRCESNSADVASAIADATAQGVNVISMSLGGGVCAGGQDPDSTEGAAIANAIAKNIIVIAATGNSGGAVEAPACDAGVIAVGATALDDGVANGSNATGGSAGAPMEYVPSYSDFGSPGSSPGSSSAWGIVAPGGDPAQTGGASSGISTDADDLHWIENVWTTTPYDANFSAAPCNPDYPGVSGTPDCRALIAGTSMAAPHVAGAAALIVAAAPAYQNQAAMKELLCSTADNIGDPHQGCGRLNVERAMAHALGDASPP